MKRLKDFFFGAGFGLCLLIAGSDNDCFLMWPNWLGIAGLLVIAWWDSRDFERARHRGANTGP